MVNGSRLTALSAPPGYGARRLAGSCGASSGQNARLQRYFKLTFPKCSGLTKLSTSHCLLGLSVSFSVASMMLYVFSPSAAFAVTRA